MVSRITQSIIGQMIELNIMDPEDSDIYAYRLTIMIESLITSVTLIAAGFFMKRPFAMAVLMAAFIPLRKNTGGLHLGTYLQCYPGTVAMFVVTVLVTDHMTMNIYLAAEIALACALIYFIGFVNHPNLDLDCCEVSKKKMRSRIVLAAEMILMAGFYYFFHSEKAALCIAAAIILDSILITLAKIIHQEV